MSGSIKTILKLLLIGLVTTIVRVAGQLLIPAGEQTALAPSSFAQNGTMPIAFTIYGIFAYSVIAALFLLIRKRMYGSRLSQGFQYGISCCAVWIVYLLEPLPHVAPLDRITYPIADSLALIAMGLLLGWMFGRTRENARKQSHLAIPVLVITICFLSGRLLLYYIADIYSTFAAKPLETLLWSLLTGFAVACVMAWMSRFVEGCRIRKAMVLGGLLFGMDLLLFNFFMPLVFTVDIPDLILRTVVDISAVTIGCLTFPGKPESR